MSQQQCMSRNSPAEFQSMRPATGSGCQVINSMQRKSNVLRDFDLLLIDQNCLPVNTIDR
jgi:hypothetical protein